MSHKKIRLTDVSGTDTLSVKGFREHGFQGA